MIRLGLIGAGKWGKNYIAAAKEAGNCEMDWAAGRKDWEIQNPNVDGVIVATPPQPRANLVLAWPKFSMMVEKPLCLSMVDAESIRGETNPIFLVDYVHLFSPAYEALRSRVRVLRAPYIHAHCASPTVRDYSLLWDQAPHALAMILGLGFTIEDAVAHGNRLTLKLSDNGFARVFVSTGESEFRFAVQSEGSDYCYDRAGTLDYNSERLVVPTEKPLTRAVRAFAQAVKDGGTDDWRFGIESSMVITKVLEQVQA